MDLFDQIVLPPQNKTAEHAVAAGEPAGRIYPRPDAARLLDGLNPEQAAAVQHGEGPLLILAGAGSGKTRVITHRIAWLVSTQNVRPASILAITFTNKAAAEMKSRIEELVGQVSRAMWVGTFHAMMIRILRRFADRLGYDRSFTILDSDDQQKVVKNCLAELNIDEKAFTPKAVHGQISSAKNALIGIEQFTREAGNDFRMGKIAKVFQLYQDKLKKSNSMDFDDILFEAVRLLSDHPDVLAEYQDRFRYILVDEYQDTNQAQYKLVSLLSARHHNLCVVGDDDQSIYSFRGANIQNILDFEKDFKNCRVIKLEQNYRSTGTVLNAANAVIKANKGRKAKKLWTSSGDGELITFLRAENHNEEGRYVAREINRLVTKKGQVYRDFALLYRLNALSRSLEGALREQGIPYRIFGGMRFYDRKEIKDVLAYLRLIMLPDDDLALGRIIQVPRRGIGDTTLEQLEQLATREEKSQLDICARAAEFAELQRPASRLQAFASLIAQMRARLLQNDMNLADYIDWVENESGLMQEIIDQKEKSRLDDPVDRIENLKELLSDALEFENSRRQAREQGEDGELAPEDQDLLADDLLSVLSSFLERAALYSEMDEDADNQDYVRLLTIHSAKGLEFGTVFLVGAEEGLFPGYRAMDNESDIEEERRLAYVAITRAKSKLYITTSRSRLVFGQTQNLAVSRFIQEIPDQCLEEIGGSRFGDSNFGLARRDGPDAEGGTGRSQTPDKGGTPGNSSLAGGRIGKTPAMQFPGAPAPAAARAGAGSAVPGRPAVSSRNSAPIDLQKGDKIRHAKFGTGRIISLEPVAGDAIVVIEFQSGETKRLLARMANLEKL